MHVVKKITVFDKLSGQIKTHSLIFRPGDRMGHVGLAEIRGKVNFALEMGLISWEEWETLINKIFLIWDGG